MGHNKRIFLLAILGLVLMCGCSKSQDTEKLDVVENLIEPTVMITAGEYKGTGVIIDIDDDYITIASVAHLMDGYDQGIVTFYAGKTGFADVFYCDAESDVCILRIHKSDMTSDFVETLKEATVDIDKYEEAACDDKVYIVGSAVSVAGNVMEGTLKSKEYYVPEFGRNLLYLYSDSFEGMSGSGCYDLEGNLLGIVTGGSDNGETVCIPIVDYLNLEELDK